MLCFVRFVEVTLGGPSELAGFYGGTLGLAVEAETVQVGETALRFAADEGEPFYHFALLVPGDRFDAAVAWARERVELVGGVFDFESWDARAIYFEDPAGSIVELIAHHGLEENGRTGAFDAAELVGLSELGVVGPGNLLQAFSSLGLSLWDGTLQGRGRLAFFGERGRTFILAPRGRGWLPTGRPAEPHPVEAVLDGPPARLEVGPSRIEATRRP